MVTMGMQGLAPRKHHFQLVYLIIVHGLFELALEQVCWLVFVRLVRFEYLLGRFVVKCAQVGQEHDEDEETREAFWLFVVVVVVVCL